MQHSKKKPGTARKRSRSEADKQRHQEEVAAAGGWYSWHVQQVQQREEHKRQQREARAGQIPKDRTDRIVTYPQRRYVGESPAQISQEGEQ